MKEDNMKLWRAVEKTNPAHTKKVKFGRAITAIDPYRQIEAATGQFGPAGQGWGWEVKKVHEIAATHQLGILVRVWVGCTESFIEQWGQSGIYIDNACKKKDEDCFKKATTDAITKCLSYMGFNTDIFFGKYDDNRYVEQMKAAFAEKPDHSVNLQKALDGIVGADVEKLGKIMDWAKEKGFADDKNLGMAIVAREQEIKEGK